MFSFSAAENILGEYPKTRYTYFDQEEKKVCACVCVCTYGCCDAAAAAPVQSVCMHSLDRVRQKGAPQLTRQRVKLVCCFLLS